MTDSRRVAFVTGASRGIGKAIAYDLAAYEAMRLEDDIRAQHGLPPVLRS